MPVAQGQLGIFVGRLLAANSCCSSRLGSRTGGRGFRKPRGLSARYSAATILPKCVAEVATEPLRGLQNAGDNVCYATALLPCLLRFQQTRTSFASSRIFAETSRQLLSASAPTTLRLLSLLPPAPRTRRGQAVPNVPPEAEAQNVLLRLLHSRQQQDASEALRLMLPHSLGILPNLIEQLSIVQQGVAWGVSSRVTCPRGHQSTTPTEPDYMLELSLSSKASTFSELFDSHFAEEEEVEDFLCEKCKGTTKVKKRLALEHVPELAICSVKRFDRMRHRLDNFIAVSDLPQHSLSLRAVVAHRGATIASGHYVSFFKAHDGWLHFDDSSVSRVSQLPEFVSTSAYLLFFSRSIASPSFCAETLFGSVPAAALSASAAAFSAQLAAATPRQVATAATAERATRSSSKAATSPRSPSAKFAAPHAVASLPQAALSVSTAAVCAQGSIPSPPSPPPPVASPLPSSPLVSSASAATAPAGTAASSRATAATSAAQSPALVSPTGATSAAATGSLPSAAPASGGASAPPASPLRRKVTAFGLPDAAAAAKAPAAPGMPLNVRRLYLRKGCRRGEPGRCTSRADGSGI
jgi:ubiquitin C-terminal hydrolase